MPVDDRWSKLSMRDRADLIKIYTKHGITDLNEIRRHYNSFGDNDGRLTVNKAIDGVYGATKREENLWKPSHGYRVIKPEYESKLEEELDRLVGTKDPVTGHRSDIIKSELHPTHPSRGSWNGKDFVLTDKGLDNVNYTYFGAADGNQDGNARLIYDNSTVLPEITITPNDAYVNNPYDNINLHLKTNGGHLFAYGTDGDDDRFKIVVPGTTPETSSTVVMNPNIQKAEEIDKAYQQAVQEYKAKRYSGRNMLGATINTNKEPITLGEKLAFINNEQPSSVKASFNADTELPSVRRQRQEDAARALKLAEANYINDVNGFNIARPWTTPNSEMSAQGAGLAAQGIFWGLDPVGMAVYEGANNAPRLFNSDKTTNEYLEEAGVPEFISPFITGGIGNGVARGIYRGFKNLYKNLPVQNQEYIQLSANNNNYKSSIKQYKDLYKFLNPDGTVRKETRIIEPKNETFNISDFDFGFGFDQDKRLMFFEPGKYIDFDLSKMSEDEVVRFFGPRAKIHKAVYDIAAAHNFEGKYAKMGKDAEQKILSGFTVSKTDPDVAAGLKDARDIYYIPEYRERFGSFGDLGNTFIDDALYRLENVELQGISNKEKILSGFDGVEGGAATGMHPTNPIITLKNYDSSKLIRDFMRHEGNHASHSGIFQPKWMQMHNEKLRPIPKKISETKSGYDNYLEDMDEIIARSKTAIEYANSIRKEGESLNEALDRLVEMSQKKYNHDIPGDVRDLTSHFTKESILKFWKGFVGVTVPGVLLPNYKNEKE